MTQKVEIPIRVAANSDMQAATTEAYKIRQREQWFSCSSSTFTQQNQLMLRRSTDDRPTDANKLIYTGYSLTQYACVFDNVDVLKVIFQHENDFITPAELTLTKNDTTIVVPGGCTPLMLAIACNSHRAVEYLLKQLDMQDVKIPLNNDGESASILAARLPNFLAAQSALRSPDLQQKEFYYQTEAGNVVDVALQAENIFLTHLFTKLLATPRQDPIMKFALASKVEAKGECKTHLGVVLRHAIEKIRTMQLYEKPEWQQALEVYYGSAYPNMMNTWKNEQEAIEKQKKEADRLRPKESKTKQTQKKALYDFSSKEKVEPNKFDLQAVEFEVKLEEKVEDVIEEVKKEEKIEEKFNLFDAAQESLIPVLISQYSNTFQPSRPEQLAAARNFASDDRVVPLQQPQINWFNVCREGNVQLCKSMLRVHAGEVDTRQTDPEKLIYNGFTGIHYATVFGRWQIVQQLLQYEALQTTKARVILKAPGIGQDRAVVVPLQSNALQLACYCNQVQIFKLIVDSIITPKPVIVDPIQQAFSKKNAPLNASKQKQILTQKNELEQTALAVLAQCKMLSQELAKNSEKEDYILQLCLDQLASTEVLDFNDQFVAQNAYLFNNVYVLKTLRQELLTNPCNKLTPQTYAQLLFKVYDLLMDMKNSEECEEVLPTLKIDEAVQREIDLMMKLIEAQVFMNRSIEDEDAEKPENVHQEHLEENQRFKKWFKITFQKYLQQIENSYTETEELLTSIRHPQYVQQFGNELFVKIPVKQMIKIEDLEYLCSVVQRQDLSYYFDCVILGYEEFVQQECEKYIGQVDRRQSNKQVINGFSALLYACYYGHINLVKLLLDKEFALRQGDQIRVDIQGNSYIFKELMNCYQAAILSKAKNSIEIIDYITSVAQKNEEVAQTLFLNHKQTSDMLKLAIVSQNHHVLNNALIREYETQHIYLQLQEKPLTPTIVFTICQNKSLEGLNFLQDIILADSVQNNQKESDIPVTTRQQIESNLLFCLQLACLQRLDGACPLDHIKAMKNPVATKFINDLTNDAILRVMTVRDDNLCERLITEYYGSQAVEIKEKFEHNGDSVSGKVVHRYGSNDEVMQFNGFVKDEKINRISFEPIQKLNEVDVWFENCKYGTLQQVQALARSFVGRREIRYNQYDKDIHQGFTGLMYATLFNTLDVVLFLMDFEGMLHLEQDALVKTKSGPFLIQQGLTPLHIAAAVADQYVIDAFFQFYFEHQFNIVQDVSVTRYLIIHNKRANQDQLMKDFRADKQVLRMAVQYARTEFLSIMGELCQTDEYFPDFYEQLLTPFRYNNEDMTMNDLIMELPSQTYTKLSVKDVQETVAFVEQAVKKVLIVMIQQNLIDDNIDLIDKFYRTESMTNEILKAFKTLSEPEMVSEDSIQELAQIQFFRVQPEQIVESPVVMNLSMQTELQNEWFRACRDNDMETVHHLFKQMKTLRDGRQTSFVNCVHTGFCGLHYAIVYGATEVLSFLFDFEWNVVTGSDTVIRGDQGRYFVPARSTILHLIAMRRSDKTIQLVKTKPSAEGLVNAKNRLSVVPVELFAGQNYIERHVFDIYLQNFQDAELRTEAEQTMRASFVHCCKANNWEFAQLCVANEKLYQPIIYKHIFTIWKQEEHNKAETLFMKLKNEALEYALLYRMEEQWGHTLDVHFDDRRPEVEKEYQNLKIWQAEQYELVQEEKLFDGPNSVIIEGTNKINPPKDLKYLRESKMTDEQHKWFAACKSGDVEHVKKNIRLAGLQDESMTNYLTKTYTQFTGLMYAIIFNKIEIVKLLLKSELMIYANAKNLVEIPNDDENVPADQKIGTKRYYLFRVCYPVILSVVVHAYDIFNFFIQEIKTQDDMLYNQFTYETMVTVDFQIPYSYMVKLMAISNFNLLRIVLLIQKDSHMKYIINFLTSDQDQYIITKKRPTVDLKLIQTCKLDQQIYKQLLSQLDESSISQWKDIGQNSTKLINTAIEYGLDNAFEQDVFQFLYNIYGEEAHDKAKDFKKIKYMSTLVKNVDDVVFQSYLVEDEQIAEQPRKDIALEDHQDLIAFLEAVKDNDMKLAKKYVMEQKGKYEVRQTELAATIFQGFSALHYAAYLNNIPLIGLLWNHEKYELTQQDVIIEALGTGFGNKYLLSKGSNALMIAVLQDNKEATQMIMQLVQADKDLERFYQRPNFRGVHLLYTTSLCWRCPSGQMLYGSKMILNQLRSVLVQLDPRSIPVIRTILYTNCSHGARLLYDLSQTDLQFKQWFYQAVLEQNFVHLHAVHDKQKAGSDAEKTFIAVWMDQIYEDALNYSLKLVTEVTWSRILQANLGQLLEIVQKQYSVLKSVTVQMGRIEIHDDLLMNQTVMKQQKMAVTKTQTGRFNQSLNATSTQNQLEVSALPQQSILQQPQVSLKSPPKVLGSVVKGDNKISELQALWAQIEAGM